MNHCGAKRKQGGEPCRKPAGWGTPHKTGRCKLHGGNTPTHVEAAKVELARQECATLGIPVESDPGEALLGELAETMGNVAFYRQLVQQLPTHPERSKRVEVVDDDGEPILDEHGEAKTEWEQGRTGVYGPTFHVSGIPTGEAKPHILVVLYNQERKHLVEVAAAALKADVDVRRIEVFENLGQRVADVLVEFARRMGLDPASPAVREAGRAALTLVAGGP